MTSVVKNNQISQETTQVGNNIFSWMLSTHFLWTFFQKLNHKNRNVTQFSKICFKYVSNDDLNSLEM